MKQRRGEGSSTVNNKGNQTVKGIAFGALAAILLSVLTAAILAGWTLSGKIKEDSTGYFSLAAQFLSCLIGFVIAGKVVKEKITVTIGICAGAYLAVILGLSLVLSDADFTFRWGVILSIIASVLLSCAICIRKQKTKRIKKWPSR